MRLNKQDKKFFGNLNDSSTGEWLIDYLERLKSEELFNPPIDSEKVEAKNQAWKLIKRHLIDNIKKSNQVDKNETKDLGDYE